MPLTILPSVSVQVNGAVLTSRQLDVLRAIHETGSQNKAAIKLGISVPVLHRYLSQIEEKINACVTECTTSGTMLTAAGQEILNEVLQLEKRVKKEDVLNISGTPVSQELLMNAMSIADPEGLYNLTISDDRKNTSDMQSGYADIIVLDDPLYLFELEGFEWENVGEDRLLHEDHGERYAYFRYGAQRIGFRYLETESIPYTIERTFSSISALMESGLSFFINESVVLRRGLSVKSSTTLNHEIVAVYRNDKPAAEKFLSVLKHQRSV